MAEAVFLSSARRPDVVLLQKSRNPLNWGEYLRDWLVFLDLDDVDFLEPKTSSVLEETGIHAKAVVAGSGFIRDWAGRFDQNESDHLLFLSPWSGVVSNDLTVWADAICKLIADPVARNRMADAAHDAALSQLSLEAVALQVHLILTQVRSENPISRMAEMGDSPGSLH